MEWKEKQLRALNDFVFGLYKCNATFGIYQKNYGIKILDGGDENIYVHYLHEYSNDLGIMVTARYVQIDPEGVVTHLTLTMDEDKLEEMFNTYKRIEF